jgi:hypothetical protein
MIENVLPHLQTFCPHPFQHLTAVVDVVERGERERERREKEKESRVGSSVSKSYK